MSRRTGPAATPVSARLRRQSIGLPRHRLSDHLGPRYSGRDGRGDARARARFLRSGGGLTTRCNVETQASLVQRAIRSPGQMLAIAPSLLSGPTLLVIDQLSLCLAPLVLDMLFPVLRDLR